MKNEDIILAQSLVGLLNMIETSGDSVLAPAAERWKERIEDLLAPSPIDEFLQVIENQPRGGCDDVVCFKDCEDRSAEARVSGHA